MGDRFRKLRRLYLARDYRVFINEEPRSSVARTILSLDSVYLGDLAENRLLNRHFSAAQAACPRAKGSAVINSRAWKCALPELDLQRSRHVRGVFSVHVHRVAGQDRRVISKSDFGVAGSAIPRKSARRDEPAESAMTSLGIDFRKDENARETGNPRRIGESHGQGSGKAKRNAGSTFLADSRGACFFFLIIDLIYLNLNHNLLSPMLALLSSSRFTSSSLRIPVSRVNGHRILIARR